MKKFDYASLVRIDDEVLGRRYACPITGNLVPSVTTILSKTGDKTGLLEWQKMVGQEKADKIKNEAAKLGTLMHAHLEGYVLGVERPRGNALLRVLAEKMANKIIADGLSRVSEVWGVEVGMYVENLYAGTTDLVGVYDDRPAIMDFKNTRKMKSRSMIKDYMDQLAAYIIAHNDVYGTNIDRGVIFMCSRDLEMNTFILEGDELEKHKESFLSRLEQVMAMAD